MEYAGAPSTGLPYCRVLENFTPPVGTYYGMGKPSTSFTRRFDGSCYATLSLLSALMSVAGFVRFLLRGRRKNSGC